MKLDRNITPDRRGKYALLKLRGLTGASNDQITQAVGTVCREGEPGDWMVDFGDTPETEFFVVRLKDKFAGPALWAYAAAVWREAGKDSITPQQVAELREYASDIEDLAKRAGNYPSPSLPS